MKIKRSLLFLSGIIFFLCCVGIIISVTSLDGTRSYAQTDAGATVQTVAPDKISSVKSAKADCVDLSGAESQSSTVGSIFVHGALSWIDDDGIAHPLRGVKVIINNRESYNNSPVYIDHPVVMCIADDNGKFSVEIDNACGPLNIVARVYAGDDNVIVKRSNSTKDEYFVNSDVHENVMVGEHVYLTVSENMNSEEGQALQISQALLTARDFVAEMTGSQPASVYASYPGLGSNCNYSRSRREISILKMNAISTGNLPNSYASWDVIMHEYGHHIEYELGIIESVGGTHCFDENDADVLGNKLNGIQLSWSEAWATVFGLVAQNYYGNYLKDIRYVNDTYYDSYKFSKRYDIENVAQRIYGEAGEGCICAVLWDLFDGGVEKNDTIELGYQAFWNVTTSNGIKTFSEFINQFYSLYPEYVNAVGANLTYYSMASTLPEINNVKDISISTAPTFSWVAQGGSARFPNDRFNLVIYDDSGSEILRTGDINTTAYTLTQNEWNKVLIANSQCFTASVVSYSTKSVLTGGYYTDRCEKIYKPTQINKSWTIKKTDRYNEDIISLSAGQFIDYRTTFEAGEQKIIQTFGVADTCIFVYDTDGRLMSYDYNSGYGANAYIFLDINPKTVIVRVRLENNRIGGTFKLAIVNVREDYDIGCEYGNLNYFYDGEQYSTYKDCVNVYTFVATEYRRNITLTVDADFDSYLYFIDPRSTDSISSDYNRPCVFNDDGAGNLQAKIVKKNLTVGVTYFVVVGPYNPSTQSGHFSLNIS